MLELPFKTQHSTSVSDTPFRVLHVSIQCSNESVFAADFHPTDCNVIVTCGKSHLYFWSLEKGMLVKKQGLFEVGHQTALHMFDQYH